jgi:hypothetical protein
MHVKCLHVFDGLNKDKENVLEFWVFHNVTKDGKDFCIYTFVVIDQYLSPSKLIYTPSGHAPNVTPSLPISRS